MFPKHAPRIFLCLAIIFLLIPSHYQVFSHQISSEQNLRQLLKDLQSNNLEIQIQASNKLSRMNKDVVRAVPALIEILKTNENDKVISSTARVLGNISKNIGEDLENVISALIQTLKNSKNDDVISSAAHSLGNFGKNAKDARPILVELLKTSKSSSVIDHTSYALGNIGEAPKEAIPALIKNLKTSDNIELLTSSIEAIGKMRKDAKDAVPSLIMIVKTNKSEVVKRSGVSALGYIGKDAQDAVPVLIDVLKTTGNSDEVISRTVRALGSIGIARDSVPALIHILKTSKDDHVISSTAEALGNFGENAKSAVPTLVLILETNQDRHVVYETVGALSQIGEYSNKVVLTLVEVLKKTDEDSVRSATRDALILFGKDSKEVVPALINHLKTTREVVRNAREVARNVAPTHKSDIPPSIRNLETSVDVILKIIRGLIEAKDTSQNETIRKAFDQAKDDIANENERAYEGVVKEIEREIGNLERIEPPFSIQDWIKDNPKTATSLGILSILFVFWLGMFLLYPIGLLKFHEKFPVSIGNIGAFNFVKIPLQSVVSLFIFHPHILDAWVKKHLPKVKARFSEKQTVKDRKIYVSIGLILNDKLVTDFSSKDLQKTFTQNQAKLLIAGEGGVGKTTLASQIARWAMSEEQEERLFKAYSALPVLLERNFAEKGKNGFQNAISAQLSNLIDSEEPISDLLLTQLLKKKRILLLIDGMSELKIETRNSITTGMTLANAIIFTSRKVESLNGLKKTVIKPTKITGTRLSSFVESYLMKMGKRELFEDEEFFEGCRRLSSIVGDRNITALLARLFVEQMVAQKEKSVDEGLPRNVAELMRQSIKVLYNKTPSENIEFLDCIKTAKIIAWECLKNDYRPLPAINENVKNSVADVENGKEIFRHLKDKLMVIEEVGVDNDIRFKMDPLAEYFAAMYLVEQKKDAEKEWKDFFEDALSKEDSPENIKGFLLAVRDCCLTEEAKNEIPSFVAKELEKMTGLGEKQNAIL